MAILNLPPTKSNQLIVKKDLETAVEGYRLLDQKREILVMELVHLVKNCALIQEEVASCQARAYKTLRQAVACNGYFAMKTLANGIQYDHQVIAKTRLAAGIRIPSITFQEGHISAQYSLINTNALVDQTSEDYLALLRALGKLAEIESAIWLLARELKKTQRHVNALDHLFIPDYKDTLHFINQTLESRELDSFFTMKMVKKRMDNQ